MLSKLETFYHIVKAGSFTKAAEQLGLTQSSISRIVQSLENELGCILCERNTANRQGLVLTQGGEEAFYRAQKMMMHSQALRLFLEKPGEIAGKIRISTTYAIANYILTKPLLEFQELHPDITFDLFCSDELIDIVQSEVDIAISPRVPDKDNDFVQRHLFRLQAGLYTSEKYIKRYGEPKTFQDLVNHRFITYSRPERTPYANLEWFMTLTDGMMAKQIVFRANSVDIVLKWVNEGFGIFPSYQQMQAGFPYKLRHILPQAKGPAFDFFIIFSRSHQRIGKIEEFCRFLKKRLGETPAE